MKSSDRCSSKFQGDRCRFPKSHIVDGSSEQDPMKGLHVGQFTVWDDYGVQKAKALGAETRPGARRNRLAHRVLNNLTTAPERYQREAVLKDLEQLTNFFSKPQLNGENANGTS